MSTQWKENTSIKKFIEYLEIPSVHPNVNYEPCVEFLKIQANDLGLPCKIIYPVPEKPVVIITMQGLEADIPSCLLNSHMDVVPVFEDKWTYPPFSGHIDEDGKIFARGSQDMKCVGIQYLEAIKKLLEKDVKLRRTVHLSFIPDEEIGGADGIMKFVKTQDFKDLNIGVALDEGAANPSNEYNIYYGERAIWQVIITCPGTPGHGSLLLNDTAGEKVRIVIDRFMDFRDKEKRKLDEDSSLRIGDVTSINLTRIYGGVQTNVIPESLTVVFDIRLALDVNHEQFSYTMKSWCKEAGEGITLEFEQYNPYIPPTKLDKSNPYWMAFKKVADELNLTLIPQIFPGGTDSNVLRQLGIPAFGFSPMSNTPILLHDHNEYLHAEVFLKGIDIYEKLIMAVANV